MGYPMSHSTQFGFKEPPTSLSASVARVAIRRNTLPPRSSLAKSGQFAPLSLNSRAVGVGHNPDSVASVSGIDGTSRNNKRPRGVADAFQVRKDIVEFHRDDSSNIFTNDPSGSRLANNAEHFRPDRTVICLAESLPGDTERLARKSTCEQVDSGVVGSVEVEDVGMEERWAAVARPMLFRSSAFASTYIPPISAVGVGQNRSEPLFEDLLCIWFSFAKADCFVTAGLRGYRKAANQMPENKSKCVRSLSGMLNHLLSACVVVSAMALSAHALVILWV